MTLLYKDDKTSLDENWNLPKFFFSVNIWHLDFLAHKLNVRRCEDFSIITYGHICLCSHNSRDSTGTSCGSLSSLPACRPSCSWSWKNNTVKQGNLTLPWMEQEARHTGNESSLLLPMACASVGGPRVRAGLLCHVVVRMWVGLLHWSGEAEKQRKEISVIHLCGSVHHFVQAEISQQLMDGLPLHCVQALTSLASIVKKIMEIKW